MLSPNKQNCDILHYDDNFKWVTRGGQCKLFLDFERNLKGN